jgi:hypothetical protein
MVSHVHMVVDLPNFRNENNAQGLKNRIQEEHVCKMQYIFIMQVHPNLSTYFLFLFLM